MGIFNASVVIFALRVLGAIALFLTYSLISKGWGSAALADLVVFLSTFTLVGTFSKFGLDQLVLREVQGKSRSDASATAAAALAIAIGLSTAASALVLAVKSDPWLAFGAWAFGLYSIAPELYRARGSALHYAVLRNVLFNALLFLSALSCHALSIGSPARLASVLTAALSLVISVLYFCRAYDLSAAVLLRPHAVLGVARIAVPIAVVQIILVSQSHGYSLMLSYVGSPTDVAVFGVFLQVTLIFSMFSTSVAVHVSRDLAASVAQRNWGRARDIYLQSCKVTATVLIPAALILAGGGRIVLPKLFDVDLAGRWDALLLMGAGALVSALTGPKYTYLTLVGKDKLVLRATVAIGVAVWCGLALSPLVPSKVLLVATLYTLFVSATSCVCAYAALRHIHREALLAQ